MQKTSASLPPHLNWVGRQVAIPTVFVFVCVIEFSCRLFQLVDVPVSISVLFLGYVKGHNIQIYP